MGQQVKVAGWVHRRRDHGGLIFIDLRDRTGLVQLVFEAESTLPLHERAQELRSEYVISAAGTVVARSPERVNPNLATGKVEIVVDELRRSWPPPRRRPSSPRTTSTSTRPCGSSTATSTCAGPRMFHNLLLRHQVVQAVRRYLGEQGFIDVETPILTKSTPEGARDFLVPSRLQPGEFYALPQSPQLFKQLLMIAGFERYYQIARAFRDEDLRADRQPEHTQIDIEMSFIDEAGHPGRGGGHVRGRFQGDPRRRARSGPSRASPTRTPWRRYGSDKPDLRFGMEIVDVTDLAGATEFRVFADAVAKGGVVRGLRAEGGGGFSRKDVDDLAAEAAVFGAQGLLPVWLEEAGVRSPLQKFVAEEQMQALIERLGGRAGRPAAVRGRPQGGGRAEPGSPASVPGRRAWASSATGWAFTWVVDFPMFEYDEQEKRLKAQHHPFTKPRLEQPGGPAREASGTGHLRLRPGAERRRTGQRVAPHLRPATAGGGVRGPGARRGADQGQVRLPGGGHGLRHPAARRHRAGPRPHGHAHGRGVVHPRRHRLPQDPERVVPADRRAFARSLPSS